VFGLRLRMASAERSLTDDELFGLARKTKAGGLPEAVGLPVRAGMTSDGHRQERAAEQERILGEALPPPASCRRIYLASVRVPASRSR